MFRVVLIEHGYASIEVELRIIEEAGAELIDADKLPFSKALELCRDADAVLFRRIEVPAEMIRQFRNSLDASPRDVLSLQCSPFHVNTPLAPEIERLTRATGIQETDDANLALAKLRSLLARAATDVEQALRYYGAVLSIPACSGYEPADFGSPSERERGFQVIIDVLVAASRKRPILVIVEDVQWMDPTTIELLVRVVANR